MSDTKKDQISLAERLQVALLEDFEKLLNEGRISPTDRATLARLLMQNGWSIDPTRLPQGLADKLTGKYDPKEIVEEDPDVLPMRRQA